MPLGRGGCQFSNEKMKAHQQMTEVVNEQDLDGKITNTAKMSILIQLSYASE